MLFPFKIKVLGTTPAPYLNALKPNLLELLLNPI
jgi:hypothetical protein